MADRKLKIINHPNQVDYNQLFNQQIQIVEDIATNPSAPYCLQFLEHKAVMTVGRAFEENHMIFNKEQLQEKGIDLCEVNRGGSITYHGPGQLIAYLHIHLKEVGIFLDAYLRELEQWVERTLNSLNIETARVEGKTGVWTNGEKICAMGIAAKRFVTYHGLGLNFAVDLNCFNYIVPCGLTEPVTSVHKVLGKKISKDELVEAMLACMPSFLSQRVLCK
jgi:lipoyl(octanoyl) transferase